MEVTTGSSSKTVFYKIIDGKAVQQLPPCRCGDPHSDPNYGIYDYFHHMCYHGPLWPMDDPGDPHEQMMCADCGEVFDVQRDSGKDA